MDRIPKLKRLSAPLIIISLAGILVGIAVSPRENIRAQQANNFSAAGSLSPADVEARVNALVSQMTLEEKIELLGGTPDGFHTHAIPRLGIPSLKMSDGPMGLRNDEPSTAFPAGIALAATWDRQMARGMGEAMGLEARARGALLACPGHQHSARRDWRSQFRILWRGSLSRRPNGGGIHSRGAIARRNRHGEALRRE